MQIKIQPVVIFPDTATQLQVDLVQVRGLGERGEATVAWQLMSEDHRDEDGNVTSGRELKSGFVILSGEEYNGWGSDDAYVLNLVIQKLGLTIVE